MAKRVPIFWIVMLALLITSGIPLGVLAYSAIKTSEVGVENEQKLQLVARADAHAATIDQQLKQFAIATQLTAAQAQKIMLGQKTGELSAQEVETRLAKYTQDKKGIYGLDDWYTNVYLPKANDDHQSDVFLNKNTQLTPSLKYIIAATEDLNPLFTAVKRDSPGTQWIYLTTPEGMMRLYPWGSGNSGYDPTWEPQKESFYTAAAPDRDPGRNPAWTNPYNDVAGAGIMVTNAVPIYDGDQLIGVMSHDLLIKDLQTQVLGFKVGTQGFAFLVDSQGNIIAHKDYQPDSSDPNMLGKELNIKLVDKAPAMGAVVNSMLNHNSGLQSYRDNAGEDWLVAYANIPSTGWRLGIMQPRSEIIAPAIDIQRQVVLGAVGLIAVILAMSVLLARGISFPVFQLSRAAKQIEDSVDEETRGAFSPAQLDKIGGAREISSLVSVFSQMVTTLQRRMNELNSIYAMGQTITANVDFQDTLLAVLTAVQQVVDSDAAEISILQDDKLVVEAWQGKENFINTTGRSYHVGDGLTGAIGKTRTVNFQSTIKSADMRTTLGWQDATTQKELLNKTNKLVINSFLGVPLMIGDRLIGTLTLVHRDAGHFTEGDKRLVSKLAAQASIAIENAIKVRQREIVLQNQIKELQIEIDEAKKARQVEEIVETDFFRDLQEKADAMRARRGDTSPKKPGPISEVPVHSEAVKAGPDLEQKKPD